MGGGLFPLVVGMALALAGCASAGGTAGIFDTGSVWYKHPTTDDVKECGGGFYPGVQIRGRAAGEPLLASATGRSRSAR